MKCIVCLPLLSSGASGPSDNLNQEWQWPEQPDKPQSVFPRPTGKHARTHINIQHGTCQPLSHSSCVTLGVFLEGGSIKLLSRTLSLCTGTSCHNIKKPGKPEKYYPTYLTPSSFVRVVDATCLIYPTFTILIGFNHYFLISPFPVCLYICIYPSHRVAAVTSDFKTNIVLPTWCKFNSVAVWRQSCCLSYALKS